MAFDRESKLIHEIANNKSDQDIFKELYQLYESRLAVFFNNRTKKQEASEDLIQETMIIVWEKAHRFNGRSKPSTWIFGIAYRKSLEWYRKQERERRLNHKLTRTSKSKDKDKDGVEQKLIQEGIQEAIQRALAQLPDKYQLVVELFFYHDFSYREIAHIVGYSERTVKQWMHDAKEILREKWFEMRFRGDRE